MKFTITINASTELVKIKIRDLAQKLWFREQWSLNFYMLLGPGLLQASVSTRHWKDISNAASPNFSEFIARTSKLISMFFPRPTLSNLRSQLQTVITFTQVTFLTYSTPYFQHRQPFLKSAQEKITRWTQQQCGATSILCNSLYHHWKYWMLKYLPKWVLAI